VKLVVVTPHFAPDLAPTGAVITRIVEELGKRGHEIEVLTSLPWYRLHRVEPGFDGRLVRWEDAPWGRITRVHPFPTEDKRALVRRAAAFAGFSLVTAALGARGPDVDAVVAVSPPLSLALTGWAVARARRAAFVFNVHDIYPDVAIELGVLSRSATIAAARRLERACYAGADAVTVLSEDQRANVASKTPDATKVWLIPNFVDTEWIAPLERDNPYRAQFGLRDRFVVMYAGNVGLSQSLELVLRAARALANDHRIVFVINGQGAARGDLERDARDLPNVVFVDMQPVERLPEVLAAADVHVVPLRRGLARASMPSKTYSILAAGRPIVASVDEGSELAALLERTGAGLAVPPEDPASFTDAIRRLAESPEDARAMGRRGRAFVESWVSPGAVAETYERLFEKLSARRGSAPR
jgi:colanic acid biosynthesis glycosyl transferase WcaI